jgi:serine/threonine-protein kinase RsbW
MSGQQAPECEFDGNELRVKVDVTVPADVREISPVVERVMKEVHALGCAEGRETDVEIALREALANAIEHGCERDSSKSVQCIVACDPTHGILLIVRDPGPGFDPGTLPSPVVGRNVFEDHGRGIFLISQLVDEVRFENNGAEIRMRLRPASG